MLTKIQGKKLLKLARSSINSWFKKKQLNFEKEKKEFSKAQGVFITLKEKGELRGCIGYPYPVMPLSEAIFQAARSAAFQDPRFEPISEEEFKKCRIEISVLSIPEEIKFNKEKKDGKKANKENQDEILKKIKIGEDGLIVQCEGHSALLLPQVAAELNWNVKEFLEETCHKAALPNSAWQDSRCHVFKFQAQIFLE